MKRNILTIFLASPSDLQEERKIIRDVVSRVNKVLSRRMGWQIELLGWEDTLPGYSRPQSLINKDVDTCELFIGILWRSWGQETGEYSSGFEEEFVRAQERRKKIGSPEIWLFFKTVDEESAKDPGEQLKKVLTFKEKQIKSKELLFKEFEDSDSWSTAIHDDLLAYVLDISSKESAMEAQRESLLAGHTKEFSSEVVPKVEEASEVYPADLVNLFDRVNTKLREGNQLELDIPDRTRLYLQTSAWFSEIHLGQVLGNHEINLIYTHRAELKLSDSEKWLVFRSIIEKPNNRPGWYWFKELGEDHINFWLTWIASNDSNNDVRGAALSLLADVGFEADRELLEKGLTATDKRIVMETIRLLRKTESVENLDLIDKVVNSEDSEIKEKAISAQIEIMYLNDPNKGFLRLIDSGTRIPPLIKKTFKEMNLSVNDKLLLEALSRGEVSVRRFSAQYLRKSKLLTKEKCHELLKDTDAEVRKEGLLELIDIGEQVDMNFIRELFPEPKGHGRGLAALSALPKVRADDFAVSLLKRCDPYELLSKIDFYDSYDIDSDEAYRILALNHFDIIKFRIRDDLDKEFENLKTTSEERLLGKALKEYKPDITEFIKHKFISAALDGLAKNGIQEDIKYARKYLGNTQFNMADAGAIGLLSKFGDSSDVESLIKVESKLYGANKRLALETAYKLSENKDVLIKRFIYADDNTTSKIAVEMLSKHESSQKIEIAKTLFNSKNDKRRLEGLAIVSRYYNESELETLLNDYVSQSTYYYNIVAGIDRCLYSKGRYLNFYKSNLFNMILE